MKFTKIASGWIETEDKPTYHGWPTVCCLNDGRLLAVASGGRRQHVCPFGRIHLYESSDGGLTWSKPRILSSGPLDDRDCGVMQAADGSILINYFTSTAFTRYPDKFAEWHDSMTAINLDTLAREHGFWMLRSTDGGRTWSRKYRVPVNNVHGPNLLNDGSLLWIGREMGHFVQDSCMGPRVKVYRSTDHGLTWDLISALPDAPGERQEDWHEVHTVQTADGLIITQIRNQTGMTCLSGIRTCQTESSDGGRTWGPYHVVSDGGHPSHLLRLADGRIVMTYGWRRAPAGIRGRVGLDLPGAFWSDEGILCDDGESFDLGYPSTVQLPDGTLLTLWYQFRKSAGIASLRWLKWKLA